MNRLSKLTNEQYDMLKFLVLRVSPALTILISGIGTLLGFDVTIIVGLLGLITAFIATVMGISSNNYNKEE